MSTDYASLFSVKGKVAVVTGGGGVLCGEMARALASLGARVAVLDLSLENADKVADGIRQAGGDAKAFACNVLEPASLQTACDAVVAAYDVPDLLVNGAGGNRAQATTGGLTLADAASPTFFELDPAAVRGVVDLNFLGTLLPTQAFGKVMADAKRGSIVNITSMAAIRPLTKVMGYGAAKAAVVNLTQWLAVHFAPAGIRVNAIAPGFFITEQNRYLMTDKETGALTPRGKLVIDHTPMKRMGDPGHLIGALVYLAADASSFVTGTVMPVDGGFAAQSGV